jgi:histone-lysine N-methyltransferase SETD3
MCLYLVQIKAGEAILLSYGQLSNDFLLMDYGFVVPSNQHDRVALRFDLDLVNVSLTRLDRWRSSGPWIACSCS